MSDIFTEKTRENKFSAAWVFGLCLLCFILSNIIMEDDKIGFLTRFMELML